MCIGIGIAVYGTQAATAAAARAERLQPASPAVLEDSAVGAEVLVEGRISSRNRARFRDFVAYIREEYRGSDDDGGTEWHEDERVTPPLLLEVNRQLVQLVNSDYRIEHASHTWQESEMLTWNGFRGEGTKRYRGFAANSPVVAVGSVARGQEGNVVNAEFLYGGTRAEYIAGQRQSAAIMPWVGLAFGGFGLLFAGIGVFAFLRSL